MNINSQIATSREQSEKLLALGLKKETADCYLFEYEKGKYKVIAESWLDLIADEKYYSQYKDVCFPAWSLHRLILMTPKELIVNNGVIFPFRGTALMDLTINGCDLYEGMAQIIERCIKEGYFNKDYLNGTTEN